MNFAVIGSDGMIGSELVEYLSLKGQSVIGLNHDDIEISNADSVEHALEFAEADIIINAAGCHVEGSGKNPLLAFQVNAIGPYNLAVYAQKTDATLVHYSTDQVFDGVIRKAMNEEEKPNPINTYGISKLSGEYLVKNNCKKHYIIRTGNVYGNMPNRATGTNFVLAVIEQGRNNDVVEMVDNIIMSPTWTMQLAKNLITLLNSEKYGLYHMTAMGDCSWYECTKLIFEELRIPAKLVPEHLETDSIPKNLILENKNLDVYRMNKMDFWNNALKRFLLNIDAC